MHPDAQQLYADVSQHCEELAMDYERRGDPVSAAAHRDLALSFKLMLLEGTEVSDPLALARRDELRFDLARRQVAVREELVAYASIERLGDSEQALREARQRLAALSPL